jgi:thiamine biosynthesis lipoprotein
MRTVRLTAPVAATLLGLLVFACHEPAKRAEEPVAPASVAPPTSAPPAPNAPDAVTPPFVPVRVVDDGQHAMGTHVSFAAFTTPAVGEGAIHTAFTAAGDEIRRIEALMTTWRPDSELSQVNAAAGRTKVVVGPETFDVVAAAIHTSEISEGTFDITFESLHGLWKFDQDLDPHPPTPAAVKAKLPLVGYRHVHLDQSALTIFIDQVGTKISLGGIAKGYAVDKAAAVLERAGLTSYFVQAGGDLFTRGKKPDGTPWAAGVRDPRGPDGSFFALLHVSDHAFSTAGDYERSYVVDGKRYHHIIDPRTGYPATGTRSVTIWAPTALVADEIDDAVFILGPEKGLALVESLDGVGAVIVDVHNKVWVSKRLQGALDVLRQPTDAL